MWQKVHLGQENFNLWPCLALNMGLQYQKLKYSLHRVLRPAPVTGVGVAQPKSYR